MRGVGTVLGTLRTMSYDATVNPLFNIGKRIEYRITVDGKTSVVNGPQTAANTIADAHEAGHVVSCYTNATNLDKEIGRLTNLAKRVNETLIARGWQGKDWDPFH